ncbi:conserved hypothetical protein [Thiomonas sp. CB2]|nr:conserved hypothetical protein [Thiomonas sp. CB2]VDY06313.1 conserved protein of unknown function [Thiomonas sp. Bio17B3]VDY10391.1 conserved protein of unknown function [Thiomonas sp. Sup16B3]VDY14584.1 hypothetical protein TOC7_31014 [Thiomonas sp. OC7]VDY16236.1 conserved protein of unknown function [Thiomonas sp. CB2]
MRLLLTFGCCRACKEGFTFIYVAVHTVENASLNVQWTLSIQAIEGPYAFLILAYAARPFVHLCRYFAAAKQKANQTLTGPT